MYEIGITCDGVEIPESPFKVEIDVKGQKWEHVKAFGPGLSQGRIFAENTFTVDYKHAGIGNMALVMEGPSKAKCKVTPKKHGLSQISYTAEKRGVYTLVLRFAEGEIPGSPFTINVV